MSTEKLKNTEENRKSLQALLASGVKPRATMEIGVLMCEPTSISTQKFDCVVTDIDVDSGYCTCEDLQGRVMIDVNINCITLLYSTLTTYI